MTEPEIQTDEKTTRPEGLEEMQIQYQLLTARLSIGDSYESADEAPEGVNDALRHIAIASKLVAGDSLKEARSEGNHDRR